jgi:outer membrane biogenesis lipoprotein LolB
MRAARPLDSLFVVLASAYLLACHLITGLFSGNKKTLTNSWQGHERLT